MNQPITDDINEKNLRYQLRRGTLRKTQRKDMTTDQIRETIMQQNRDLASANITNGSILFDITHRIDDLAKIINYVKELAYKTDAALITLRNDFETLKSERIGQSDSETAQNQPGSSDSDAKNGFCPSTAPKENAQPESVQNGQKSDEEGEIMSFSPKQCCGNCGYFLYEDADGSGWCKCPSWEKQSYCADTCSEWKHRPLIEGEAVLWKTAKENENYKLGYYCHKEDWGHSVRDRRTGGAIHRALIVQPLDTFNPYEP